MYQLYVGNQEFSNPTALIIQNYGTTSQQMYNLSSLISFKDAITYLILQTPIGQDINRAQLVAQCLLLSLTGPTGNTPQQPTKNKTAAPDIYNA
jgi:hypothetical protein